MIREMELLFQASRTSPMLHEAAVTVEAGVAALRNERDELVLQNERLGNDFVAAETRCARLQQALGKYARIALLAWEATGGTPGVDATDSWNDLCRLLEDEPDSFPDECREALAGPDTPADSQEGE